MEIYGYKIEPYANLCHANLWKASLQGANLQGANLRGANLRGANLKGANLQGANLLYSDLRNVNFRNANLRNANLRSADLQDADFRDAKLMIFQIPQEGTLTVYKKLRGGVIAKLLVPAEARRTATPTGRKCRAEFVDVLELPVPSAIDMFSLKVRYTQGARIYPDSYNHDWRIECTNGIHFFLTREEAEDYL